MTTVTASGPVNNPDVWTVLSGTFTVLSSNDSSFTIRGSAGGGTLTVLGSGFTYANVPLPNGVTGVALNSGTINTVTYTNFAGTGTQTWSGLSVSGAAAFNALVSNLQSNFFDLFFGGGDTFNLHPNGSGLWNGYGGNDIFNITGWTSGGSFTIDGGAGTDTLNLTGGIPNPFPALSPPEILSNNLSSNNFFVSNVETVNLSAGSNYFIFGGSGLVSAGNTLTINGSALGSSNYLLFNTVAGGFPLAGNLVLIGGSGNDYFQGGTGNTFFNGGAGTDTVSFQWSYSGVTANLSNNGTQTFGATGSMFVGIATGSFAGIENLSGTDRSDQLTGNDTANILDGTGRSPNFYGDTLSGLGGSDTLVSSWGDDVLDGGSGNDRLNGSGGNDILDGGTGWDIAIYSGTYQSYTAGPYSITLQPDGSVTIVSNEDGHGTGTDTLINIEALVFSDRAIAVGNGPVADFNATGQSDLLWQNTNGQAAIWLMNGATRTGAAEVGSTPGTSWHIRGSGDFDGDGKFDILWQNDSGLAALWLMNGTGIAGTAEVGPNPGASWRVAGAGDFNGDGRSDILWQNKDGRVAIWMMNGTVAGLNGLVAADNPGTVWRIVGSGDFNGDTKADILFQRANGDIAIWLMDGLGVLGSAALSPGDSTMRVKAVGDFNGDFKADIVWQSDTGEASIWNMDGLSHTGGGTLAINPGTSWHIVGTGTYDTGNTKLDLLWQNDNGNVTSWYMDNTIRTGGDDLAAPGASWKIANNGVSQPSFRTSDFDGDGKADFLWYNIIDHRAAIWTLSNGAKTGGDELSPKVDASWRVIGSSDFNGDGKADIVWQNVNGAAAVWLMNGTTRIGGDTIGSTPGADWTLYDTGDFNGDGNTDLLWQNWRDGTVAIWTMNGLVRTGGQVVSDSPGPNWHVIGSGDFNGDGKSDILFQNQDGRAGVWLMNGFSLLQGAAVGDNPGTNWIVKGAGDFDGDGKSDILWQTSSNGQMAIWKMDGLGVVNTAVLNAPGFSMWTGIQDMNGDGKSDILFLDQTDRHASAALMNGITKIGQYDFAPISDKGWQIYADAG